MSDRLEQMAAACLFPGFEGSEPPAWIRRWVADGLGGVILYARNVESREQLAALTSTLKAERGDLLIAVDEEGGDVTRIEAATGSSYPGNAALGAVDDVELTEQVAAAIAWELVDVGANMNLAPVADVNTNPANPVIGVRSFGSDAELAARHVAASVRGLQSAGIVACAKHFPGHGDTDIDSHRELPTVESVAEPALVPFRAAIDAGVFSIMTAHIRIESLGEEPATTSRRVLHDLLREQLGFAGMVMTDALEMRAISATMGVGEGAVRALEAGADALCLGHDLGEGACSKIAHAIADAVRSGRLAGGRLAQAAERVRLNGEWASHPPRGDRVGREFGFDAARRAIRWQGNPTLTRPPLVVELSPEPGIPAGQLREGPADWFRRALPDAEAVQLVGWPASFTIDDRGRQRVIVVRDAHRHSWERAAVEALLSGVEDGIVIETGLPAWRPVADCAFVVTYGAGRVNVEAAIERLYSTPRRGVEQSGSSPGS